VQGPIEKRASNEGNVVDDTVYPISAAAKKRQVASHDHLDAAPAIAFCGFVLPDHLDHLGSCSDRDRKEKLAWGGHVTTCSGNCQEQKLRWVVNCCPFRVFLCRPAVSCPTGAEQGSRRR